MPLLQKSDTVCSRAEIEEHISSESSGEQQLWNKQIQMIRGLYKEDLWQILSPELVLTFWSLSYGDIFFPAER